MFPATSRYIKIALLNLLIVVAIAVILRYKIAFALAFIDQKQLLHGHSHFAFVGWISHTLMVLLIQYLARQKGEIIWKRYKWILNINLIAAYGMLISFPIQGYGAVSISFSTLGIVVAYAFTIMYWRDLSAVPEKKISHLWFRAALLFNVLSSAGTFTLAYMMATRNLHQQWYLLSVYFYLHFQYNGWFFFACMGLACDKFLNRVPLQMLKQVFWLFTAAAVPAYLLSALWLHIPQWLYILVVLAAISQVAGCLQFIKQIMKEKDLIRLTLSTTAQWLLMLSVIALAVKLLLQLGSTVPSLSQLAFGFRPIVIGYLHLILLGVITLFLLGYMVAEKQILLTATTLTGIRTFTAGIIINEILLMTQGVADLSYLPVPFINEMLFITACTLFIGILIINTSQIKKAT